MTNATTLVAPAARRMPFHVMGQAMPAGTSLDEAMLGTGMLGWDVTTGPARIGTPAGNVDVPDRFGTYRRSGDGYAALAVGVTATFKPIQNEEAAAFVSEVLDTAQGDLIVDAAGTYGHGAKCFVSLRLADDLVIGGDAIRPYVLATWGHDGKSALRLAGHEIRLGCTNQIAGIFAGTTARYTVRHVGTGTAGKADEARTALRVVHTGLDNLSEIVSQWAQTTVVPNTFEEIVDGLLPTLDAGAKPAAQTRRDNARDLFHTIYASDTTAGVKGSAWGALNAWTEMTDWAGSARSETTRATSQMDESGANAKARMLGAKVISRMTGAPLAV